MSKRAAVRVEALATIPLDIHDVEIRVERRYWADQSSCLHIAKWAKQPSGRWAPWYQMQYIQVKWGTDLLEAHVSAVSKATLSGDRGNA